MRLELLHRLRRVVDKCEACALAATILRLEAEDGDLVLGGLVQLRELGSELILGYVRSVRVKDITAEWTRLVCYAKSPAVALVCVEVLARIAFGSLGRGSPTRPSACGPGEGFG